jgi:hypothetical protein
MMIQYFANGKKAYNDEGFKIDGEKIVTLLVP